MQPEYFKLIFKFELYDVKYYLVKRMKSSGP